jgi:uncharacterized protein
MIFLIRFEKRKFKAILIETFLLKGSWPWKLFATIFMPLVLGISYLISRFVFGVDYNLEWFKTPLLIPIVYLYILLLGGPLGEEIGWRGYALRKMLEKLTPFSTSLILGFIWTFWHIPAFFIEGSAQQGISFYLYVVNTIILTIFITILYIKTNFRISSAFYFHASSNFALGIFYIIDEPVGLATIAVLMISCLLYLLIKYRSIFFTRIEKTTLLKL